MIRKKHLVKEKIKKLMRKSHIMVLISFLMIFMSIIDMSANEKETDFDTLRVGLVTQFKDQDNIQVFNKSIVPGFYKNGTWMPEATIFSVGQMFTYRPSTATYLMSDEDYKDYEKAKAMADQLKADGFTVYPSLLNVNTWKVYVETVDVQMTLNQINTVYDTNFLEAPYNKERIIMTYDQVEGIVFDNSLDKVVIGTKDKIGDTSVLNLGKGTYRGKIEIGRYGKDKLLAVNIVDIEDYLYSVVVSEIYASWPLESIKAQAVAARTFAIYYVTVAKKFPNEPYDLDDTVNSQVYKGYGVEDKRVSVAVDGTRGKMIYYDGSVIPAYFFSTSGGRTEASEHVWSASVPYLKSMPDLYETEPARAPWIKTYTPAEIESALMKRDITIGTVLDLEVMGYTDAGRVLELKVIGSGGTYILKKETMRQWLGMDSRKFTLIKPMGLPFLKHSVISGKDYIGVVDYNNAYVMNGSGKSEKILGQKQQVIVMSAYNIINQPMISGETGKFILAGVGYGHGVGMSQSGAKGMALAGYTYKDILEYYYKGAKVK
ncbi:SpoIID/LytB domain-containing protein [Petrocella sp. FN5]|uniref:SpoIID/LytB domain-containing protein n=1 Tax=Petrocella sp. FN5 TaxID=3032002 RepID=UPI0023DCAA32|nr:SpoIID/LytB domain-containing protein [Petrocella sp. FN5]MDF1617167.1 SpoIID/LytB domain-containing protein [Petrocella sp. FN5]